MPRARKDGLIIKILADEVLVYDVERHLVHCLNRAAALVWRNCDGKKTFSETAALVRTDLKTAGAEHVVALALERLRQAKLLRASTGLKTEAPGLMSRRNLIRKLSVATAVSLPLVTSILLPQAAAAQSVNCAAFTTQVSCEDPLKPCGASQFFCRFRNGACVCTNT